MDSPRFDPKTATEYEIIARANEMIGRTLGELADTRWSREASAATNKGAAGTFIERYFGIQQNSEQAPDFEAAGVELKVVPVIVAGGQARRIKERTSVSMIDYKQLDRETWPTATVRKKINRVLFVFFEWRPDVPIREFRVRRAPLWSPSQRLLPILERDWTVVWQKNHRGLAHEISEADGLVFGAATKGASGAMREQPNAAIKAKSRAWALKPRLTLSILAAPSVDRQDEELLAQLHEEAGVDPVEALLARIETFVGRTPRELAGSHGIELPESKDRAALVIRGTLGLRARKLPPELEGLGLEIKTVPLGPGAEPYEAMSFPAFDHRELIGEEWGDSDLYARIQNVLVVPLYRENRDGELLDQKICRPFRWSADRDQVRGIRLEWERYRDLVAGGEANALPHESETTFVHVRTHGRDGGDTVEAPGGLIVGRKSFWLNRGFVRELVLSHSPDWKGF
jgi:DNA mismatch repair endonuclease MutH